MSTVELPLHSEIKVNLEEGKCDYVSKSSGSSLPVVHKIVAKLANIQVVCGIISMFFGILLEITAVFLRCDRWCYTVPVSKHAAGIWCGAAFLAAGMIGFYVVRKRSTFLVVVLMSASLAAALFAVCEIMFGIAAMMNDKHKIEENPSEHKQYDYHRNVRYVIFAPVYIPNFFLVLIGFFEFFLFVTTFGLSCAAICCQANPIYLRVNLYEPVSSGNNFRSTYYPPQYTETEPLTVHDGHSNLTPVYMMPTNQQGAGPGFPAYQLVPFSHHMQTAPSTESK